MSSDALLAQLGAMIMSGGIEVVDCSGLASLANLDKLPPKGAILITAPLKIRNGTGSPIRALALAPRG
jgi:hypothetical protein